MLQLIHVLKLFHLKILKQTYIFKFPDYTINRTTLLHTLQDKEIHPLHHFQNINLIKYLLCDQMTEKASDNFVTSHPYKFQENSHTFRMITHYDVEKVKYKVSSKLHSHPL